MKKFLIPFTALLFALGQRGAVAAEPTMIDLTTLAKKARPAVMLLVVYDAGDSEIATGTGFLVSSDGKLITNYHVVEKAARVVAKAENGGLFPVLGVLADDPDRDLAVLQIEAKGLPALPMGSSENIESGTRVAVIGSPLGLEGTLSEGIVSAIRGEPRGERWIQITAAISPGSSGSPVLNADGEVVGVAALLMRGGQSLNFAIPSEAVKALLALTAETVTPKPFSGKMRTYDKDLRASPEFKAIGDAILKGDRAGMLAAVRDLVIRFPDSAEAHERAAGIYSLVKFYDDALTSYQKAIDLAPDYAEAWRGLAGVYEAKGQHKEAVVAYQKALKLFPEDWSSWWFIGESYVALAQYEDAEMAYKQAIKLVPGEVAELWSDLGLAYDEQGKTAEAVAAYRAAIKLKPDDAVTLYRLGYFCAKQGQYAEASEIVHKLETCDPKRASLLLSLLQDEERRGRNPYAHRDAARLFMSRGDCKNAIAEFTKVLELQPVTLTAFEALTGRAGAYSALNEFDNAIRDYTSAIELMPYMPGPYNGRAWTLFKKGDLDKAIKDANRAISANSEFASAWGTRGWIKFSRGDMKGAAADLKRAVRLAPGSAEAYCDQGMLHFIAKEYAEAAVAWEKAIEVAPFQKNELEPWIRKAQEGGTK